MHPRVDDLLLDDHVGLREHRLGGGRVTGLPVEAVVVGLAFEVGADHRRGGIERGADVHHGVQRVVLDVDQLQRVAGRIPVLGNDERHLLALEAHLVGGQHGLHVVGQRRHPGQTLLGQVGAGHHRLDLRMCLRGSHIDADDAGVRVRRAQDRQVQHPRQRDVVDVAAAAPDEPGILLAQHPAVAARLLVVVGGVFGRRWAGLDGGHDVASAATLDASPPIGWSARSWCIRCSGRSARRSPPGWSARRGPGRGPAGRGR